MNKGDKTRAAAPEWVASTRADRRVDQGVNGGWLVADGPPSRGFASTNFAAHTMTVPAGESALAQAVRAHELIHAAISPTGVPAEVMAVWGLSSESISLAEEIRVNAVIRYNEHSLQADGRPLYKALVDGSEIKSARQAVEENNWRSALIVYLASYFTGAAQGVRRHLYTIPEWKEALKQIENSISHLVGKKAELSRYQGFTSTDPTEIIYPDGRGSQREIILPFGFFRVTVPLAILIEQFLECNTPGSQKEPINGGQPADDVMKGDWDHVRIGQTRLTEPTARFFGKRRRPAITGKIPRRPDRLLTDPERRVFSEEVKGQGGVVVFDCSGSMSIAHHHVTSILSSFSGATIIAYANHGPTEANTWILARNGRMVSEAEFRRLPLHGGNGIDAPVVSWAAKMKRSRKDFLIWISDGEITGRGDRQYPSLFPDMAKVIRRHGVTNVAHEDSAVELVKAIKLGRAVPRAYTHHWRIQRALNDTRRP